MVPDLKLSITKFQVRLWVCCLLVSIRAGTMQIQTKYYQKPRNYIQDAYWYFATEHSFIPDISIASLQVHYYSEAHVLHASDYSIDTVSELTCRSATSNCK